MGSNVNGKNIFSIFLLVVIAASLVYWYLTKPTPQEKAVNGFFNEVRLGNAEEASKYLLEESYGKFLINSKILDSDGRDMMEDLDPDEGVLADLAWSYIPAARGRVMKFDVVKFSTQKSKSDPNMAFVQFEFNFTVKERFDEPGNPGNLKGNMECSRVDKKWLLKRGEFTVKIIGITIRRFWEE